MRIVINISEELYKKISLNNPSYGEDFPLYYAVRNCIKLPKGHGRLIDADALKKSNEEYLISSAMDTEEAMRNKMVEWINEDIDNAPTIIEADKEGEQE